MRICYVSTEYKNPHVKNWVDEFSDRGHIVYIVTPAGSFIKKMMATKWMVNMLKPDIVHAHYASGYGVFGAYANHHPFILSCWGGDVRVDARNPLKRHLIRYALKSADIVHVQDPLMAERVREIYPKSNIFIQAWGVNVDIFKPRKEKLIDSDYPLILCTRDTSPIYDIKTLIDAIPMVLKKVDAIFVFTDDSIKKLIETPLHYLDDEQYAFECVLYETIKENIPNENIKVTGFLNTEDYIKLLQSCDLFVDTFYPFDGRGGQAYGQALLEAMACKVPTLVADRPTLHLEPKWYFGETFKGGSPVDLATKLVELIEDADRRREIADKNRKSVVKYFNWRKNMDIIEENLYKRWFE